MNLGFYSYFSASVAYGFFSLLLLFSWRESLQGKLLFVTMFVSCCWAAISVQIALHNENYLLIYQVFEIIRYIAWYVFLLKLFSIAQTGQQVEPNTAAKLSYRHFVHWSLPLSVGFACLLIVNVVLADILLLSGQFVLGITGNVILSLVALAVIEQLFRNMSMRYRWATKYFILGAGGIFGYDFYLYADALLFQSVDQALWDARGVVHLVAVPLLAIASARNKNWSLNIFVSREIVLNTTAFVAGGFYLLAMAAVGYYLREFGGSWGKAGQVTLIVLAVVFLFVVMSSTQFRAQVKVFLGKHFYKNKYDYRVEWLRLTEELNDNVHSNHYQKAIVALAQIVDARAGLVWLRDDKGRFSNAGVWQSKHLEYVLAPDDLLIRYFETKGFVVNLREVESKPEEYEGFERPDWLLEVECPWLIVPLHGVDALLGFIVLSNPLLYRAINWEDRDLLKAAAKQVASHLMVLMTSAQLAEAKQFEVFSRLSAYMVHDLKNISAELELVAINARKHAANPEFVKDAFETVENASSDIDRLLEQLRNRRAFDEKKVTVNLNEVVRDVVASRQHKKPAPVFDSDEEQRLVVLEKSRLGNVLSHLIDNAQQATEDEGDITVTLSSTNGMHLVAIIDSGHGMDQDFIRNRLFKPFDTTKGNAGMGIGMYESREFLRQLGGDIYAQSEPGKGAIITLQIPVSEQAVSGH